LHLWLPWFCVRAKPCRMPLMDLCKHTHTHTKTGWERVNLPPTYIHSVF
jgi:hypothetical protein